MASNEDFDVDEFMRQCLKKHGIDIQAEYQKRLADYALNHAPRDYKAETERGDALRAAGLALPLCWLPEPQERWVQPPLPGKRDDGKLWFEGEPRHEIRENPENHRRQLIDPEERHLLPRPRDVRRGDKWLPWHFGQDSPENPEEE